MLWFHTLDRSRWPFGAVWLAGLLLTFCSFGGSFVGEYYSWVNYSWVNIGLGGAPQRGVLLPSSGIRHHQRKVRVTVVYGFREALPSKVPISESKSEHPAPTQRTHDPLRKLFSRMIFKILDETSCITSSRPYILTCTIMTMTIRHETTICPFPTPTLNHDQPL